MPTHFLYMIKGVTRSITPAFVLGIIIPVWSGRDMQLELLDHFLGIIIPAWSGRDMQLELLDHLLFIQSQ